MKLLREARGASTRGAERLLVAPETTPVSPSYEFGPFRLDSGERVLHRDGRPVALAPKAFDLLRLLVETPGKLLEKQALMQALWPDTFVEEANLAYTVSALRKALGDGREEPQYIATVPTRGYRFVAPVRRVSPSPADAPPVRLREDQLRVWQLLGVVGLGLIVFTMPVALLHLREEPPTPRPARLTLQIQEGMSLDSWNPYAQISPDGSKVALKLLTPTGTTLWHRSIDSATGQAVPGTENASSFSWSPDGRNLAFNEHGGILKRVALAGGVTQTRCDGVGSGTTISWSRDGFMLFDSSTHRGPLRGVAASGADCRAVTTFDQSAGEHAHRWPYFLPDGRHFLYTVRMADPAQSRIYVGSLDSHDRKFVLHADAPAIYASGHLLFPRAEGLVAQPFNLRRFEPRGAPVVLATGGTWMSMTGVRTFSASNSGVLNYPVVEYRQAQFAWFDRSGNLVGTVGDPGAYATFDLSPDGGRLAFSRFESDRSNIWVLDLARGAASRVTFGAYQQHDPRWAPNDDRFAMTDSWRWIKQRGPDSTTSILHENRAEGWMVLEDWSPDGRFVLVQRGNQLLALAVTEEEQPILISESQGCSFEQARFSPDGQWIAYNSNESGRFEVYIARFPATGQRWQISTDGGVQPVWRRDGQELYYLGSTGTVFAVPLDSAGKPAPYPPRALFATPISRPSGNTEQYAVAADGQRFLFLKPIVTDRRSSIAVILDWPDLVWPENRR